MSIPFLPSPLPGPRSPPRATSPRLAPLDHCRTTGRYVLVDRVTNHYDSASDGGGGKDAEATFGVMVLEDSKLSS